MTSDFSSGTSGKVLALSGGVGGAKLVRGLCGVLRHDQLTVVANTGDDFDYWGLRICPDLDSILYAMADMNDAERGWGLKEESWRTLTAMRRLGGEHWFQLGDQDLATHIFRSQGLAAGQSLTEVTAALCEGLGVAHQLLPMTEQAVRTKVETGDGWLDFQHYFVGLGCEPEVTAIRFDGVAEATLNPAVVAALQDPALQLIVICPSNPFVSIDPILALPECRRALKDAAVPIVAVSPIISGKAVKGPAAKMMRELDMPATASGVAAYYRELAEVFIVDQLDAQELPAVEALGLTALLTPTLMTDLDSKLALARDVLSCVDSR